MNPDLKIIRTQSELNELVEYLKDKEIIAFDTETTGLTDKHEIIGFSVCAEETVAFYVILSEWKVDKLEYLGLDALPLMQSLAGKSLIMHNSVFDCMMVEAQFKVKLINSMHTDTMILAHLLNENRKVGLKELAREYYGEDSTNEQKEMELSVKDNGGIWMAKNKEMYKADSILMAKYGAKDALLTFKLFNDLAAELVDQDLVDFFYEESMPLLRTATYDLNTTGLQVDTNALRILKNTLIAEIEEAKAFIYKEIEPRIKAEYPGTKKNNTFNIGSSQMLAKLIFGTYGLEFESMTKGGRDIAKQLIGRIPYSPSDKRNFIQACTQRAGEVYIPAIIINGKKKSAKKFKSPWAYIACDKDTIKKLAPKYKWIERLLEYQKKMKLLSTYVEGIEERIAYGVIKPSYLQHGTMTGRYASRNPNFQNLPRDDQRIKECILARPGKVFVSADFSQLEPRTFASYSQDKRLMAAFDGKSDFYSVVGREVYDKYDSEPQKDGSPNAFGVKYKKLRDISKVFALAVAYGGLPNHLAKIMGRSVEDAEEDIDKYLEKFPGVQKMTLDAHNLVKSQGFVTNIFGRKRRIPDAMKIEKIYGNKPHARLPSEARKLLNMACNFRIQSTGASIVNRSSIAFYSAIKQAGINCKLVSQIHDELVVECNEADAQDVSTLLQHCMENTVALPGVKLEAIPRISKNLAK